MIDFYGRIFCHNGLALKEFDSHETVIDFNILPVETVGYLLVTYFQYL